MRQTAVALCAVALVLALVLALASSPSSARPRYRPHARPRRFVAVPLEHVQLIREVRRAPPPPPPHAHGPNHGPNHGLHHGHHHGLHRHHQSAASEPAPYEDLPQAGLAGPVEGASEQDEAQDYAPEPDQPRNRFERSGGGGGGGGDEHEYVDYGAHTGHHGAFGWYADFPVATKGHR